MRAHRLPSARQPTPPPPPRPQGAAPAAATELTKVLSRLRHTFVVADMTLPDCPLVYASES